MDGLHGCAQTASLSAVCAERARREGTPRGHADVALAAVVAALAALAAIDALAARRFNEGAPRESWQLARKARCEMMANGRPAKRSE